MNALKQVLWCTGNVVGINNYKKYNNNFFKKYNSLEQSELRNKILYLSKSDTNIRNMIIRYIYKTYSSRKL